MHRLLIWLHVMGMALSFGSGFFLVYVFYPAMKSIQEPSQRMKAIAEGLKYFHPTFLFGICLVFMTGAIRLTDLKIGFGNVYYPELGRLLMIKFGLTMMIFLIAGGQCFGMGLKFQRMANGVIPADIETQERLALRIKKMMNYNLIFLAAAVFFGLKLLPIIYKI